MYNCHCYIAELAGWHMRTFYHSSVGAGSRWVEAFGGGRGGGVSGGLQGESRRLYVDRHSSFMISSSSKKSKNETSNRASCLFSSPVLLKCCPRITARFSFFPAQHNTRMQHLICNVLSHALRVLAFLTCTRGNGSDKRTMSAWFTVLLMQHPQSRLQAATVSIVYKMISLEKKIS